MLVAPSSPTPVWKPPLPSAWSRWGALGSGRAGLLPGRVMPASPCPEFGRRCWPLARNRLLVTFPGYVLCGIFLAFGCSGYKGSQGTQSQYSGSSQPSTGGTQLADKCPLLPRLPGRGTPLKAAGTQSSPLPPARSRSWYRSAFLLFLAASLVLQCFPESPSTLTSSRLTP